MQYFVFQKLQNNQYRLYDVATDKIKVIGHEDYLKITVPNYYQLKNGIYDDQTEDHLRKYGKLFEQWRLELLSEKIDIFQEKELYLLVAKVFYKYCTIKIKDLAPITYTEYKWYQKLNLASAMYFDETIKDTPVESYSYDFKSFYPKSMSSKNLIIPNCEGVETKLDALPAIKNLKCGIYHVNITSDNKDFKKSIQLCQVKPLYRH